MTAHPIDTEALREWIESQRHHEGVTLHVSIESAGALIDQLAAAEHRATRAEAQAAIRGRAVVIYRERAREAEAREEQLLLRNRNLLDAHRQAEAERDEWKEVALQERGAALDALEQIKAREARIKAVRDVLDQAEATINHHPTYTFSGQRIDPIVNGADIRRALDG